MLKVDHLQVFYGNSQALWDVSFEVPKGEIVALIGSNGVGKTTTLKTISGLIKAKSGTITLDGKNIENSSSMENVKNGLVLVPEGRRLFPEMTVLENLYMGAYLTNKKNRNDLLENVYELFPKIKERNSQLAGTLSGGEQQMVAIGRGLMANPRILMLDEPSLGLAPLIVDQVFKTIKNINKKGITILLVEQNTSNTLKISNRGYVIESGRTIIFGTGKELLNNEMVKKSYLGIG